LKILKEKIFEKIISGEISPEKTFWERPGEANKREERKKWTTSKFANRLKIYVRYLSHTSQ